MASLNVNRVSEFTSFNFHPSRKLQAFLNILASNNLQFKMGNTTSLGTSLIQFFRISEEDAERFDEYYNSLNKCLSQASVDFDLAIEKFWRTANFVQADKHIDRNWKVELKPLKYKIKAHYPGPQSDKVYRYLEIHWPKKTYMFYKNFIEGTETYFGVNEETYEQWKARNKFRQDFATNLFVVLHMDDLEIIVDWLKTVGVDSKLAKVANGRISTTKVDMTSKWWDSAFGNATWAFSLEDDD